MIATGHHCALIFNVKLLSYILVHMYINDGQEPHAHCYAVSTVLIYTLHALSAAINFMQNSPLVPLIIKINGV